MKERYLTPVHNNLERRMFNFPTQKIDFNFQQKLMAQNAYQTQNNLYLNMFETNNINNFKASSFCTPSEMIYNNPNNPFNNNQNQNNYFSNGRQMIVPTAQLDTNAFTHNDKPKKNKKKHNKDNKDDTTTPENQYVISFDKIISNKDKRTTLMIRNIPNKYTISALMDEINSCFEGKYDFLYLPLDYKNNCNLGFAFINFINPLHILMFHDLFCGKKWKKYNSVKKCDLSYAKFQGKKELTTHFENMLMNNNQTVQDDKKPIILTPPFPLPKVEVPMSFLEAFKKSYRSLQYDVTSNGRFVIKTLFN